MLTRGLQAILWIFFISLAWAEHFNHPKYNPSKQDFVPNRYIVELKEGNTPSAFTRLVQEHQLDVKVDRMIEHKFLNAVSIQILDKEQESNIIHTIMQDDHVESVSSISYVHPVEFSAEVEYRTPIKDIHNLTAEQVGLLSPHHLSQVDRVHSELHLTGKDIFVGIIDSGVDYTHPALGGGFGKGFKVVAGYDLVGNNWNSSDPESKPTPRDTPLDNCGKGSKASGHGTHVSGIIAGFDALNNFTGVAPEAKLGMWRVFSCDGGSAHSDIIIHAMLMAYDAGVDVLSMSLGTNSPFTSPRDIRTKTIEKIAASGVSVVISAGNNGRKGAYTTGVPANALNAFGVASVNNEYLYYDGSFTSTSIDDPIGFNYANGTDLKMSDGDWAPSFEQGMGNLSSDACNLEDISSNVQGKIALVKRGDCKFEVKLDNVQAAGGVGVVIYDDSDKPFKSSIQLKHAELPISFISLKDGARLLKVYKSEAKNTITFNKEDGLQFFKSPFATAVSDFSSVGPTADLSFKPNIAGVGELIYSSIPIYKGTWGIKQGTSMACPYVAGSIALYLQHHGKNTFSRNYIYEAFQNYASPVTLDNLTSGEIDNPVRQGAGLIQVYDTIVQTAHASPAEISFNDTFTDDYKKQSITLSNYGTKDVTFRLYNNITVSVEPYRTIAKTGKTFNNHPAHSGQDYADIMFSITEIHIAPNQNQTIVITVNPPSTDPASHIVYGGFIQFDPVDSPKAKAIQVPYFGVVGNQREIPIFDVNYKQHVTNNGTDTIYDIQDTISYQMEPLSSETRPSLLFNFTLFSPTLVVKAEVLDESKTLLGYAAAPLSYVQRDFYKDKDPRKPIVWNGQYFTDLFYDVLGYSDEHVPKIPQESYISVKSGTYFIRISALKQFGDLNNSHDWESFTAGPIQVENTM